MTTTLDTEDSTRTRIAHTDGLVQKDWKIRPVRTMPQNRWPVITTSISGIGKDVWNRFKNTADTRGITDREAAEEAIRDLSAAVEKGDKIEWQPAKTGSPHSVRAHEEVWSEIQALTEKTGFRQNVLILTAITRWMEKDG